MSEENSVKVGEKVFASEEYKNVQRAFLSKWSEKLNNASLVQSELDKIDLNDLKYKELSVKVQLQYMKENLKYLYEIFDFIANPSHDPSSPLMKVAFSFNPGSFVGSYGRCEKFGEMVGLLDCPVSNNLSQMMKYDVYKLLQEGENLV